MIQKLTLTFLLVLGFVGLIGLQPAFAATDPLFHGDGNSNLCSDEAANSVVCKDKTDKNPLTGSDGLLVRITNIIAYIAGAAAVIVIIVSSIRFITSGGDSGKISTARTTLINVAIGLIVIVLARTLIVYVLNRI